MGADLYIETIHDRQREQFEPVFNKVVRIRDLLSGRPGRAEMDGPFGKVPAVTAVEPVTDPETIIPEIDEALLLLTDVEDTDNAEIIRTILLDLRSAVTAQTDEPQVEDEDFFTGEKRMGPRRRTLAQRAVMESGDAMHARGYFRDNYNPTSLAWLCGFSWWEDVIPMCDENGMLSPVRAKELLDMVQEVEITEDLVKQHLAEKGDMMADREDTVGWLKYYQQKKEHFVSFLDEAIRSHESILASL